MQKCFEHFRGRPRNDPLLDVHANFQEWVRMNLAREIRFADQTFASSRVRILARGCWVQGLENLPICPISFSSFQ
jgi:hypothetical protein